MDEEHRDLPPEELITKQCKKCWKIKPLGEFYRNRRSLDGHEYQCKECRNKRHKQWRSDNPEKRKRTARKNELKRRYGISEREYRLLLRSQGGVCAICKTGSTASEALCVDHEHSSGRIRGLLCKDCNLGLGLFRDKPSLLFAAIKYLGESI